MILQLISKIKNIKIRFNSTQTIFGSFILFILLGSILLSLPISSNEIGSTDFLTCLFTATSSMCVTGLVVVDTATHWSMFGQIVILILIQVGGLGVIVVAALIAIIIGQKFSIIQRATLQEALSVQKVGGIIKLTKVVITGVVLFELCGAILLFIAFIKDYDFLTALWYSFFHSISAFCNAGFDLMGNRQTFSSLTFYHADILVNITIMSLIVIGGIGFSVWNNIIKEKDNFRKWTLQTKIVIITTLTLIIIPAIYFYYFEFNDLTGASRILSSIFQSITTRTAGFNTADLTKMSDVGKAINIILMLIGGSPGSTAGGMKTTTFAVLVISTVAIFKKENEAHIFNRRIEIQIVKNAITIFMMYLTLLIICSFIICRVESISLLTSMFEVASAIGTVGLTLELTTKLSVVSRVIIIILMFLGRIGGLTFIYSVMPNINKKAGYIKEDITVG